MRSAVASVAKPDDDEEEEEEMGQAKAKAEFARQIDRVSPRLDLQHAQAPDIQGRSVALQERGLVA
jgi:hypothetical protein